MEKHTQKNDDSFYDNMEQSGENPSLQGDQLQSLRIQHQQKIIDENKKKLLREIPNIVEKYIFNDSHKKPDFYIDLCTILQINYQKTEKDALQKKIQSAMNESIKREIHMFIGCIKYIKQYYLNESLLENMFKIANKITKAYTILKK
jgi:hypothetical protein